MLTINTNVNALKLQHNLSRTTFALDNAYVRLSTGAKINSAADGAAQLMLSKGLETQISGLSVCNNNAQMAKNLLGVADGVLTEVASIAQRLRDISLMAANGVYSLVERVAFQQEADALVAEIKRQVSEARFNDYKLFKKETAETGASPAITQEEAEAAGYTWVTTADELQAAITDNKDIALGGNIDLTGIDWTNSQNYSKTFEGNNYTISNLTDTQGLFTRITGGTVRNLNLKNFNIEASGGSNLGALAGTIQGTVTIDNVHVLSGSVSSQAQAGGLIGQINDTGGNYTVTNCSSSAYVSAQSDYAGGLVGLITVGSGTIEVSNSYTTGDVSGSSRTGGLVGRIYNDNGIVNISDSYATGSITGGAQTGGLVGRIYAYGSGTTNITNSYAKGKITGGETTGGLTGHLQAGSGTINVSNSYATGSVTGTDYTGGLVGSAGSTSTGSINISDSHATSRVQGRDRVGGLAGCVFNESSGAIDISNSYATGDAGGDKRVGGLIGRLNNSTTGTLGIENSYSTGTIFGAATNSGGFIGHNSGTFDNDNNYYNSDCGYADTYATGQTEDWFTAENLNAVGITNVPASPSSPGSGGAKSITFQIGTNAGELNTVSVDMDFEVGELNINLMDADSARSALVEIDNLIQKVTKMQGGMGASSNIIDSVIDNNTQTKINLTASNSRLIDADIAKESAEMIKNQIRQNMTASLLTQATNNLGPIALTLMGVR